MSAPTRLQHSKIIEATLINVGTNVRIEEDLDYASGILDRAIASLQEFEEKADIDNISDSDAKRASSTLNIIYALEEKLNYPNGPVL